jgi:Protein of unknown function (DUF2924)
VAVTPRPRPGRPSVARPRPPCPGADRSGAAGSENIDVEIARLCDLDVKALRAQWHNVLGRAAPPHLPRHLLFRIVAHRLQADRFGDLDPESKSLLDGASSPEKAGENARSLADRRTELKLGTVLGREWNSRMHRVSVLADGFTYDGKAYSSLSKIALAITGTRWNGPRFFGLRDTSLKQASA